MTALGVYGDEVVDAFLWARLNGDQTLRSILSVPVGESRVANMLAPAEWGDGPFIVWEQTVPMRDVRGSGGRIFSDGEYRIRAVGRPAAWGTLRSAAARVDVLLEGATGSTPTGFLYTMHRIESYRLPEDQVPGDVWHHVGGIYRCQAG
jgi:hypothetical protein